MDLLLCIQVAQRCIRFKGFVLVVWNEKRCFRICDLVFSVSKSEGRASSSFGIIIAYQNTSV